MNKRHYMPYAFKDQVGHFLKLLDVLSITPNLKVGYCNLPNIIICLWKTCGHNPDLTILILYFYMYICLKEY